MNPNREKTKMLTKVRFAFWFSISFFNAFIRCQT